MFFVVSYKANHLVFLISRGNNFNQQKSLLDEMVQSYIYLLLYVGYESK